MDNSKNKETRTYAVVAVVVAAIIALVIYGVKANNQAETNQQLESQAVSIIDQANSKILIAYKEYGNIWDKMDHECGAIQDTISLSVGEYCSKTIAPYVDVFVTYPSPDMNGDAKLSDDDYFTIDGVREKMESFSAFDTKSREAVISEIVARRDNTWSTMLDNGKKMLDAIIEECSWQSENINALIGNQCRNVYIDSPAYNKYVKNWDYTWNNS